MMAYVDVNIAYLYNICEGGCIFLEAPSSISGWEYYGQHECQGTPS